MYLHMCIPFKSRVKINTFTVRYTISYSRYLDNFRILISTIQKKATPERKYKFIKNLIILFFARAVVFLINNQLQKISYKSVTYHF